jgi:cyclophilin family peptidyl-prolyl cis-trans isomerase
MVPVMARLVDEFSQDLRFVYRHFPLSIHDKALLATQAAEAAGLQGGFWPMHDLLYESRSDWGGLDEEQFMEWLVEQAADLGLDREQFSEDLTSEAMVSLAKEAWERNAAIGMPGTPFMVINGYPYNGDLSYANLAAAIKSVLLEKKQFFECPPMTIDPDKQYIVTLNTEKGDISLELYADAAPLAVNSFIFLAENGWFDGITFHRVIPGYVAQAGDPSGTGMGGPGYFFDNEVSPDLTFNGPGVLGMANAGPGSNGSQFFITYAAAPKLNGGYTIFGRVISGMDVAESLTPRDPSQSMDLPPGDKILGVTIEVK